MAFRSDDIKSIIENVSTPYSKLRIFTQPQLAQQRLYPSIEINNIRPEATQVEKDITKVSNRFEITIFARYGSNRAQDTQHLRTTEQNLIALLEAATLDADEDLTVGQVILEQRDFDRQEIKDNPNNVNGIQSVLVIEINEVQATEAGVALGSQNTISIGSIADAKVYNKPIETDTEAVESVNNAVNNRTKVYPITDDHKFFFVIGYTDARAAELRSIKNAHAKVTATYKRNGVSESKNGWLVEVANGAPYESVETLDCLMELVQ